jgi:hypothetical protein
MLTKPDAFVEDAKRGKKKLSAATLARLRFQVRLLRQSDVVVLNEVDIGVKRTDYKNVVDENTSRHSGRPPHRMVAGRLLIQKIYSLSVSGGSSSCRVPSKGDIYDFARRKRTACQLEEPHESRSSPLADSIHCI